jgi:hypothetical protein
MKICRALSRLFFLFFAFGGLALGQTLKQIGVIDLPGPKGQAFRLPHDGR